MARKKSKAGHDHPDGAKPAKPAARKASTASKKKSAKFRRVSKAQPEKDGEDEEDGVVFDVDTGVTLPSVPVKPSSGTSVPAVRPRAGVRPQSALDRFLREVGRYPLLTQEQEQELTTAVYERKDRDAARKLVVHNLRLVVKMAYRYRRAWANVLDLVQEGNVGLMEAVKRYDPHKGARFSTYATFWIRAYMLKYLLEHSRMVRISRTRLGRKLFFQLSKEREKLRAQGIEPGPKLLAERLGVDEDELREVVSHMDQQEVRLDAPLSANEGSVGTVLDTLSAQDLSPEAQAYRSEMESDITQALDAFAQTLDDEREKRAWEAHLMSEDPKSLSELGKEFGVTKQRMGQIVNGLRKRLKTHLTDTLGSDVELGFQLEGD